MDNTSSSQLSRIKSALMNGDTLTPLDALKRFGCFSLGARIWELRHKHNLDIRTERYIIGGGKSVAAYSLNTQLQHGV